MPVKFFDPNQLSNEDQINKWVLENPNVKIKLITHTPLYDLGYDPNQVLNFWIRTTVVYDE